MFETGQIPNLIFLSWCRDAPTCARGRVLRESILCRDRVVLQYRVFGRGVTTHQPAHSLSGGGDAQMHKSILCRPASTRHRGVRSRRRDAPTRAPTRARRPLRAPLMSRVVHEPILCRNASMRPHHFFSRGVATHQPAHTAHTPRRVTSTTGGAPTHSLTKYHFCSWCRDAPTCARHAGLCATHNNQPLTSSAH